MNFDRRLTDLETRMEGPARRVVVVDRGEGPTEPAERAAWIQSKVPPGTPDGDIMVIRVIREDPQPDRFRSLHKPESQ